MSRGHESGMDFEYQNRTGPIDSRSPFANISQNAQRFPRSSPTKQTPSKALPPIPAVAAFNSLYNTPRKTTNDFDDSSAGETPKSPEHTDNDATPDTLGRSMMGNAMTKYNSGDYNAQGGADRVRKSPTKEKERPTPIRRESLFGKIKNKLYSPGRGEIPRTDHSGAIEKRVKRRRDKELQRHASRRRRHSVSDSGEDSELPRKSPRKTSGRHQDDQADRQSWLSATFTFIAQHPTVPHILSFYAQLIFNVFLLAGCAYLIYCFWAAVQGDVNNKSHEAMAHIMAEMAACAEQYTTNRCDRSTRVPAMETVCENWAKCMNQDPAKVGRAKVSATTFAEIFNSFVEPISWKAMMFTFLLVFGCFATTNMAFGFFRDKAAGAQHYPPNYYNPPPPPTPQRSFSSENAYYGTPWHQPPVGLEPAPSGGFGQIEGRGSPVRRLVYN